MTIPQDTISPYHTRCNHTILDYGTFGLWAALLAGGRIIVPAGYRWIDQQSVGNHDDNCVARYYVDIGGWTIVVTIVMTFDGSFRHNFFPNYINKESPYMVVMTMVGEYDDIQCS